MHKLTIQRPKSQLFGTIYHIAALRAFSRRHIHQTTPNLPIPFVTRAHGALLVAHSDFLMPSQAIEQISIFI
jgi:hypothetical protein